jgi:hypothetical protein
MFGSVFRHDVILHLFGWRLNHDCSLYRCLSQRGGSLLSWGSNVNPSPGSPPALSFQNRSFKEVFYGGGDRVLLELFDPTALDPGLGRGLLRARLGQVCMRRRDRTASAGSKMAPPLRVLKLCLPILSESVFQVHKKNALAL